MTDFLGGGSKRLAQKPSAAGALRVQTSSYGQVVPMVYGVNRIACNIIWYGAFTATPHSSSVSAGKGGGGGGGATSTSYTYSASVALACGEGPILVPATSVSSLWQSKAVTTAAALGAEVHAGADGQAASGYLEATFAGESVNYSGTAYLLIPNLDLGSSPDLPSHSIEMYGLLAGTILPGYQDVNPADVLPDFLTADRYGAGFPSAAIGDLTSWKNYCQAVGLLMSPVFDSQDTAASHLTKLIELTNSAPFWSEGLLKVVPYGDSAVTGNGVTWTPDLTPIYDLTDDDFLLTGASDDPVTVARSTLADANNVVQIEYVDRANGYNVSVAEAQDQAAVELYGKRVDTGRQAHHITLGWRAAWAAQHLVQRQVYIRNTYSFTLGWRYCLLEPMDLVTLTDSALGLDRTLVRITGIQEDKDGELTMTAEEMPAGVATAALYSRQTGNGYAANYNADPGPVITPVFFEPPDGMADGLQVWVGISGSSDLWAGCDVYVSRDDTTYKRVGTFHSRSRMGTLSAALPAGAAVDQVNTLSVDLSESSGSLTGGTVAEAQALDTLCYVDGEYLAYETATLTAANRYDLTYLVRGAHGSAIGAHGAGTVFVRLDDGLFQYDFDASDIGQTIYVKFVSFNSWGSYGEQTLAGAPAYAYTIKGSALASALPDVTGLTSTFVDGFTTLQWGAVADFRQIDYEVRRGATWSSGQVLGRTTVAKWVVDADGTYWVATHATPTTGLDVYSAMPVDVAIAGAVLERNVVATWDEVGTGWAGTLSGGAGITSTGLTLGGSGNLLADANVLAEADLLYLGGVASDGYYEIPVAHQVDIGRVAACALKVNVSAEPTSITDNLLADADLLSTSNALGTADPSLISVTAEIALATTPGSFGAWAPFVPGQYNARELALRLHLQSFDTQVTPVVTALSFAVDVPDRIDTGTEVAVPASGFAVTYSSPFNDVPNVQVTILDAQAGDTLVLTGRSASGFTMQITNGGAGVARTVNWAAQGY